LPNRPGSLIFNSRVEFGFEPLMIQMPTGEILTRWTVRVALALYVLSLTLRAWAAGRSTWLSLARLAWTGGCMVFLLHIVCAFQFYHHWSHAAAYEATAQRTAEVTGLNWGGGLYANYVFAAVWLLDVGWWWLDSRCYLARRRMIEWSIQGLLGFIAFNATVVFGRGAIRWAGLAAIAFLAGVFGFRSRSIASSKFDGTTPKSGSR
jgi:hypothetical protein